MSRFLSVKEQDPDLTGYEHGSTTRISTHLIGYEDSNIKLLSNFLQFTHHAAELLLPLGQLASARVVNSEQGRNGVDNLGGYLAITELGF